MSERVYILHFFNETTKIDCKTIGHLVKQNHRIGCDEGSTVNKDQSHQTCGKAELLSLHQI